MAYRYLCIFVLVVLAGCSGTDDDAAPPGGGTSGETGSGARDAGSGSAGDAVWTTDAGSGADATASADSGGVDLGGSGGGVDAAPSSGADTSTTIDASEPDVAADVGGDSASAPDVEPDAGAPVDVAAPGEDTGSAADTGTIDGRWLSGDPTGPGPYDVSQSNERIDFGPRQMDVLFFAPGDTADAPFPVVVFNHGFQMPGSAYAGYGEHLASHGFVVLLPTVGDSLFGAATHRELGDLQVAVDDWIASAAATDGSALFGLADPNLLGVGGHSRGGKQSILAATLDDRIRATFNVDPVDSAPPFGGSPADFPSVTPELMGGLAVPAGYVGAGRGAEMTMGQACAPADENHHAYFEASASPAFEWVIASAAHNDFVESCDFMCELACPVGADREGAQAFARTTMVAFYKVFLAGDESYRPWIDGDEVVGATLSVR